jgi:hypothetical protein
MCIKHRRRKTLAETAVEADNYLIKKQKEVNHARAKYY